MSNIPPAVEDAVHFLRTYIPDPIVDNWRVVGTTAVMVGLCLCPLIGSAWEGKAKGSDSDNDDDDDELSDS